MAPRTSTKTAEEISLLESISPYTEGVRGRGPTVKTRSLLLSLLILAMAATSVQAQEVEDSIPTSKVSFEALEKELGPIEPLPAPLPTEATQEPYWADIKAEREDEKARPVPTKSRVKKPKRAPASVGGPKIKKAGKKKKQGPARKAKAKKKKGKAKKR